MGAYPNDRSNDPLGPITYGRDFNFFKQVTPGSTTPGVFTFDCDAVITFPSYTVTFWVTTGTAAIQYSFNGNTVHGIIDGTSMTSPSSLTFENRQISKIWFSGTGTVRVEAWAIR